MDEELSVSEALGNKAKAIEAYIGAELYSQRMFPFGCPSYQKAQVKLLKQVPSKSGGSTF